MLLDPTGATVVGHYAPGDPTSNVLPPGGPDFQAIVDRYINGEKEASDPVLSFLSALNSREREHVAATAPAAPAASPGGTVALGMDAEDINAQTNLALTAHGIQRARKADEAAQREERQKLTDVELEHPELADVAVPIATFSPNNPGGTVRQNRITGQILGSTDLFGQPIDLNNPDAVTRQTAAARDVLAKQPYLADVRQTQGFWRGGRMPRFDAGGAAYPDLANLSPNDPNSPVNRRARMRGGDVSPERAGQLARAAYLAERYGQNDPRVQAVLNGEQVQDFPELARGGRLPRFAVGGFDMDSGEDSGPSTSSGPVGTPPTTAPDPSKPTVTPDTLAVPATPSGPAAPGTGPPPPSATRLPDINAPGPDVTDPDMTAEAARLADVERQEQSGLRDIEQARNEMLAEVAQARKVMENQTANALADIQQKQQNTNAYYANQEAGIDQQREAARKEFEAQMAALGTTAQTAAIGTNTEARGLAARNPYIIPPPAQPVTIGAV